MSKPAHLRTAEQIKCYIREYHESGDKRASYPLLDEILFGKKSTEIEYDLFGESGSTDLRGRYPGETPWSGTEEIMWTAYPTIGSILKELKLTSRDIFYDLGSGYGRVPLYAGIVTHATCKGIEMIPERADIARQTAKRLKLTNVEIISGKVLDVDFSDGNVFYIYHSFSEETFPKVLDRLAEIAKPFKIVAQGNLSLYDEHPAFKLTKAILPDTAIYEAT